MTRRVDVLPAVLDAAGVRRAVLIGHSDGGSIAAIHAGAVQDPRVVGMVLIAAHFFVEELNIASIRAIKASITSRAICGRGWRGIIVTWMWRSVAGTTRGWIRRSVRSTSRPRWRESGCRCWRCRARTIRMARSSNCACWNARRDARCETLLIAGRASFAASGGVARRRWRRSCRLSAIVLMEAAA